MFAPPQGGRFASAPADVEKHHVFAPPQGGRFASAPADVEEHHVLAPPQGGRFASAQADVEEHKLPLDQQMKHAFSAFLQGYPQLAQLMNNPMGLSFGQSEAPLPTQGGDGVPPPRQGVSAPGVADKGAAVHSATVPLPPPLKKRKSPALPPSSPEGSVVAASETLAPLQRTSGSLKRKHSDRSRRKHKKRKRDRRPHSSSGGESSDSEDDPGRSNKVLLDVIKKLLPGHQVGPQEPPASQRAADRGTQLGPPGQVTIPLDSYERLVEGLEPGQPIDVAQVLYLKKQLTGLSVPEAVQAALVPQEVTPSANTVLEFKTHNEEFAGILRSFMESSSRGDKKWAPPSAATRASLPSQGSDIVDKGPSYLGLPAPKRLVEHLTTILSYKEEVPVRSLLSSTVRLDNTQFAEHCKFSTHVSNAEANYLGHYSNGKVSSEKQVEKLVDKSKGSVWTNAKDALLAPSAALKDALVVGSANEAALAAIVESRKLAEDSRRAIAATQELVASFRRCPSALKSEIEANLNVAAARTDSICRRQILGYAAGQLTENVSVAMADAAARGVRTALSHARGEAMDAIFGKVNAKGSSDPARTAFRNNILSLPFTGTSLFGGRLTQATTAAVETAAKVEQYSKYLSKIGMRPAKGTSGGKSQSQKFQKKRQDWGRRRRRAKRRGSHPWSNKASETAPATTKSGASKAKPPKKGGGKPGKGRGGKGKESKGRRRSDTGSPVSLYRHRVHTGPGGSPRSVPFTGFRTGTGGDSDSSSFSPCYSGSESSSQLHSPSPGHLEVGNLLRI